MIIVGPLALWGADSEIQQPKTPIARLEVQPARIDWPPQTAYERLVLTVAGPGDLYIHQEFGRGETPYLSLFDSKGAHLPDGSYAYELRVESQIDRGVREGGKFAKRALVQSGYLAIREGSFVDTDSAQGDPTGRRSLPSKPPLRNITAKDFVPGEPIIAPAACLGYDCEEGDATNVLVLASSAESVGGLGFR